MFFQKAEVYEAQNRVDDLRTHLRVYLEKWGKRGGLDRQVQAHFRLGELAWNASCAHASEDGACLRVDRLTQTRSREVIETANRRLGRSKRTQCGPATKSKIVMFDRNRPQASAAEEHFRAAIDLWKAGDSSNPIEGPDADARRASAAYAAAGAAFYLAEKDYEDLLRVKFPQSLDFSDPTRVHNPQRRAAVAKKLADSKKRFAAYLDEKSRLLEKTRLRYVEVFKLRQAQWTIAAAARVGSAAPGLRRPALHRRDPEGPARNRPVGKPPARSLLRAPRGAGREGRNEGRSKDSVPAWTRPRVSPGSTTGRARASAS